MLLIVEILAKLAMMPDDIKKYTEKPSNQNIVLLNYY